MQLTPLNFSLAMEMEKFQKSNPITSQLKGGGSESERGVPLLFVSSKRSSCHFRTGRVVQDSGFQTSPGEGLRHTVWGALPQGIKPMPVGHGSAVIDLSPVVFN